MKYQHHLASNVELNATSEVAFEFLNDPHHLSSHMRKKSIMMAGSKMDIKLDSKGGKVVGSEIILEGAMMGIPLFVREFVTEIIPAKRKIWETEGPQKMLIIDQYKMGFDLSPNDGKSNLHVFINYNLPKSGIGRLLGKMFARSYAQWCTDKMASDAKKHFRE